MGLLAPFEERERARLDALGVYEACCPDCTGAVKVYEQLLPVHESDALGDLCLFLAQAPRMAML